MSDSRYSTIFINYDGADRDILTRQLKMLKERFRAEAVLIITSDEDRDFLDKNSSLFVEEIVPENADITDTVMEYCRKKHIDMREVMFIRKLKDGDNRLKEAGFYVKDPIEMAESNKKAMEMLQNMVNPLIKK